jgi:hypothetical protein
MSNTTRNEITKSSVDDAWRTLMTFYGNLGPPEDWEWETEEEKLQQAAGTDTHNIIDALVDRHNPEHFMLTLGNLFAKGVAHVAKVSKEEHENVLSEFVHRLRKYGGMNLIGQLREMLPEAAEQDI